MLKKIIKTLGVFLLKIEAKLILKKYKPKIVAITGSVGKTSTKDAVATVLSREFFLRKSPKSYNSELGVPLTIIGAETPWNHILKWVRIFFRGLKLILVRHDYPELLVLEMGVDRPGDMDTLLSWVKPNVGVITGIGEIPVHIEYFSNAKDVTREKFKLIAAFNPNNFAILNGDDPNVFKLKDRTNAQVLFYGFDNHNDLIASDYHIIYRIEKGNKVPEGVTFKVTFKGNIVPVRLKGILGKHQVYSALAGIACGVTSEVNLLEASEALLNYRLSPGRLNVIEGINESLILDDTYNASPAAVEAALDTLGEIESKGRKIAVLGDMLELGRHASIAHKEVGYRSAEVADILLVVGVRAKLIADGAREKGFGKSKIFEFHDFQEAGKFLKGKIEKGDLVLVKGSQSMRMEKIVETIMASPEDKEQLLVRQEKEWQER